MKFDVVILNPPYKGNLHIDIHERMREFITEGGNITSINPATPYINIKPNRQRKNIKKHESYKQFTKNNISKLDIGYNSKYHFEKDLDIYLAISSITLGENPSGLVKSVYYRYNNTLYNNIDIEDVNKNGVQPDIYRSTKEKILQYISENGTIEDSGFVWKEGIISWRKGCGRDDFFSKTSLEKNEGKYPNLMKYLTGKFARYCLSLYRFSINNHRGELQSVPTFDFSIDRTDWEYAKIVGITEDEYKHIRTATLSQFENINK